MHKTARASLRVIAIFGVLAAIAGCAPVSQPMAQAQLVSVVPDRDYSGITIDADIVYDAATGQTLDVCMPAGGGDARPAVLEIHGGSWARGDKADLNWRPICQWLASEGFVAVSVNYRLAPAAVFPAQIDDVTAAAAWLTANAEDYGVDPERIAAFGGSAGGNLASLLGTTSADIKAVVDLSGPSDLTATGMADDDPTVGIAAAVHSYLACADLAACPAASAASPIAQIDADDPPFFIAHSESERVALSQSQSFADALTAAGVDVEFRLQAGSLHSIAMLNDTLRGQIIDFLDRELAPPTTAVVAIEAGQIEAGQ
ncbi:alpha/beta hydrolase [Microbacteriaceae bacterium VKM Ac-2854]|nr:alpha/beta hydrolase [Microbacteriaceae bacterium VKM Ac-2854]